MMLTTCIGAQTRVRRVVWVPLRRVLGMTSSLRLEGAGPARLLRPISRRLRNHIVGVIRPSRNFGVDYDHPTGDPGLFGPDSATWKMHADFPGMMAGGLCALMLQTLHPRALAGVWDHSSFRETSLERLRRTTLFVGATSFAPRADA